MLKRILAAVLGMAVMTGAFSGCGDRSGSVDNGDDTVQTFTVGFDAEFPPYGYQDDSGEYVGFDLSLAQEVCDRNGWELVKKPIDWEHKDTELKTGAIDCIWNGFTINGREDDYTWSTPYIDNSQVIVVKTSSEINSTADLAGKVVAVQADSSALQALEGENASEEKRALAESFAELRQAGDYTAAFEELDRDDIDAVCLDYGMAAYRVNGSGGEYKILEESISAERYGVGFLKGNTALRDRVEETLTEMYNDGTLDKIADRWADKGIDKDSLCFGKSSVEIYPEPTEE